MCCTDYLLPMSEYFKCVPDVPKGSTCFGSLSGGSEVNPGLSIVQWNEHRSQSKARDLKYRIISGSSGTEDQGFKGSGWGQVDNEIENQGQYLNMNISYKFERLIYRVSEHSINQGCQKLQEGVRMGVAEVWRETQQGNVYMNKGTGRQGWRETRDKTLL